MDMKVSFRLLDSISVFLVSNRIVSLFAIHRRFFYVPLHQRVTLPRLCQLVSALFSRALRISPTSCDEPQRITYRSPNAA